MLAACAQGSPAKRDFCLIYRPVYTARADTAETKRETDGNNAAWLALCAPEDGLSKNASPAGAMQALPAPRAGEEGDGGQAP
jgi:hypothetical protein